MQYKIILYGNKVYKEICLSDNIDSLTIGTYRDCQFRLQKSPFQIQFRCELHKTEELYALSCGEEVYLYSADGVREQLHELVPGDRMEIRDTMSDIPLLFLDFSIDFGEPVSDYNRRIHTSGVDQITIGADGYGISVRNPVLEKDYMILTRCEGGYEADIRRMRYGIEVNGVLVKGNTCKLLDHQFIGVYGTFFHIDGMDILTTEDDIVQTTLPSDYSYDQINRLEYPEFIRSVRLMYPQPEEKLEVLQPPSLPAKPKEGLVASVLPSLMMMVMMMVLRSMMTSRLIYALYFAVMMGMSIVMTIINYFRGHKEYREKTARRLEVYNDYINRKDGEIQKEREEERTIAWKMNLSAAKTVESIMQFDAGLFARKKEDPDFLDLPIGLGLVEAANQVKYKENEYLEIEDPLVNYPEMLHDKFKYLDNMPVILKLSQLNAVGFLGTRQKLYDMTRNIMLTISGQHIFSELRFYMVMNKDDVSAFFWARWLQNFMNHGIRSFIYDEDSRKSALDMLYSELTGRENMKGDAIASMPHCIVFVYRSDEIKGHPLNTFVKKASSLGFTFLFFEEYQEFLHEDIDILVCLDREKHLGYVQLSRDAVKTQGFSYQPITEQDAQEAAIKLAPVYINEISLESTMTKNISLYQLLGIYSAYDLEIGSRWKASNVYESMAVPIGVDANGDKVYLDIHEKGHGPHGLVAGTTGAGKSELLQTYVLSLCSSFHPYEVGIVIIDFKGGGMANQFRDLPHLNGAITNIDGKQIDRSLMSIRAELMKRQRLFAEFNVNRIDDYIALFKGGTAKIPLPHLLLIVDEFAELKSDQPEFMKELVSTARIGRSLGVHMILATQKPSGVVTDQIWSNSRFKLCLKVQDKQDSNEVLKSPLAAEIREPGRCYLEVGNMESFELLQSAYSGAPAGIGTVDQTKAFDINILNFGGRRQNIYHQEPEKESSTMTQLDAMVEYIADYCEKNDIKRLPPICLPALESRLAFPDMSMRTTDEADIIVPLGIYDDPTSQLQEELALNLTRDNTFIIGSSLSGKTNLIQTILRGIAESYSPEEVNVYIMDFASMILRNFNALGHVGGVVTLAEDTKFLQLIEMVSGIIEERKQRFAEMGLSSFGAYLESGQKEMPQIIFVIENYAALKNAYPEQENDIMEICREGISVGVSMVVTNATATGIGYKFLTNFSNKIAMYCNDSSQYTMVLDKCKMEPDNEPGRGITMIDKTIMEFQTYLSFDAEKESDRVEMIRAFVSEANQRYGNMRARIIPTIPEHLDDAYMIENYGVDTETLPDYRIPVGLRYDRIVPEYLEMLKHNLYGFSGRNDLGRADYVLYILRLLEKRHAEAPSMVYIVDDVSRELSEAEGFNCVAGYGTATADAAEYLRAVFDEAKSRFDRMGENPDAIKDDPLVLLVFNHKLSDDMIMKTEDTAKMFDLIVSKLGGCRVCILMSNLDNTTVSYKSSQVMRQVSDAHRLIIFEDAANIKLAALPIQFARANSKKLDYGSAFFFDESDLTRVRIIT